MMRNLSGTNVASLSCRQISMVFVRDDPKLPKNIKGQRRGIQNQMEWLAVRFLPVKSSFYLMETLAKLAIAPPLLA